MSINLKMNATHPIQIHTAVKKLRFEKKVKKILSSNISEIYGPIILPKELDQELSKVYLQQGILKRLRQFYSRNRWMYKTHFFHFSGFTFF